MCDMLQDRSAAGLSYADFISPCSSGPIMLGYLIIMQTVLIYIYIYVNATEEMKSHMADCLSLSILSTALFSDHQHRHTRHTSKYEVQMIEIIC